MAPGRRFARDDWLVAGATLAYLLVATFVAIARGNQEFVFYIVVMAVLIGAVLVVHRQVGLHRASLWALSAWGFLHMAGGLVPAGARGVLYNVWIVPERLKYDQVVHAYGFGVATWVCWQVLRNHLRVPGPAKGPLIVCAAAGMGLGALNEVVEFVATLLVPETNVGGYVNTGWDLVANLVGATVAVLWIARAERRAARG